MAIKTTSSSRFRTVLKTFSGTLGANETAYAAYESSLCDSDTTKTWQVRIVNGYWDGSSHVLIAEASYPEVNEDPTQQVPILT